MTPNQGYFYDFGPFRIDRSERVLKRDDDIVPLPPKTFELLLVLVESSGHVLAKEELMKRVWPDSFVEEANLSHNIYKLREALGESDGEKYIQTLPRRGYRFVAKVTEHGEGTDLIVEEHSRAHILIEENDDVERIVDAGVSPISPAGFLPARKNGLAAIANPVIVVGAVVLIGIVAAGIYFWGKREPRTTAPVTPLRSIAVLPFKPLVASERDESLEMGMADTLITKLSHIGQLSVRPTSAVRNYTKLEDETMKAGRALAVDAVLDGSIQKSSDRVRVSVRLVRVEPQEVLWSEQFDEKLTDIFSVQDSISSRVTEKLALRLSGEEKNLITKRYTENTEAYQLYLRGRFHWNKRTDEGLNKAIAYFNQAIEADPSYALAYAGLADSYCLLPEFGDGLFHEDIARGKAASLKALEIDNSLGEAHISLAYAKSCEWEWSGAEEEYKRGLMLNPSYATGHQWYSEYLTNVGRLEEAMREIKLAQQLDPLSLTTNTRIGVTLYYSRRYDEAIEQLQKSLEFGPDFTLTHIFLYASFYEKGMHRESIPHIVKGFLYFFSTAEKEQIEKSLNEAYAAAGTKGLWEKVLDVLKNARKRDYNYSYTMAETYMRLGDKDQAFFWLQKAYELRHPGLAGIKVEPAMDVLRDDQRFVELIRRTGL